MSHFCWLPTVGFPRLLKIQTDDGTFGVTSENGVFTFPNGINEVPENASALIELPLSNAGQLPAVNVDWLITFDSDRAEGIARLDEITNLKQTLIPPSYTLPQAIPISAGDFIVMSFGQDEPGDTTGYFGARVHYDDMNGRSWRVEAAFEWTGMVIHAISMSPPVEFDRA